MPRFTAAVATLRGWPWLYGRNTLERVFQKGGSYTVIVPDQWETDTAYDVRRCYVQYRP